MVSMAWTIFIPLVDMNTRLSSWGLPTSPLKKMSLSSDVLPMWKNNRLSQSLQNSDNTCQEEQWSSYQDTHSLGCPEYQMLAVHDGPSLAPCWTVDTPLPFWFSYLIACVSQLRSQVLKHKGKNMCQLLSQIHAFTALVFLRIDWFHYKKVHNFSFDIVIST